MKKILISILFFISFSASALAPEERLADESQEQRATKLFLQVRCLICGGQVIENSDTEFSFEMRKLIRQKITAKKSDDEIKEELRAEFGDDILTDLSGKKDGFFLWCLLAVFATTTLSLGYLK